MSVRIQVVLEPQEREAFRARARAEGRSLSQWLRDAGRTRLQASESGALQTPEDLTTFFAACDVREEGSEPDWTEHVAVIADSRRQGLPST